MKFFLITLTTSTLNFNTKFKKNVGVIKKNVNSLVFFTSFILPPSPNTICLCHCVYAMIRGSGGGGGDNFCYLCCKITEVAKGLV